MNSNNSLQVLDTMTSAATPPRLHFQGPARHQNWSLPEPLIHYVTKNPSSPKMYRKLIRTCKYFYAKNPIVCLSCLHHTKNGWKICKAPCCTFDDGKSYSFDLDAISCKIWVLNRLDLYEKNASIPSMLISKLHRCDAIVCKLVRQSITFDQFKHLCSAKFIDFCELRIVTIKNNNGFEVQLDELVDVLPKIKILKVQFTSDASNFSSTTIKKLIDLEHFSKLKGLSFCDIPDTFDIKTFCEYIKTTKAQHIELFFRDSVSDAYKKQLDSFADKILSPSTSFSRFPYLEIPGIESSKSETLYRRFSSQF